MTGPAFGPIGERLRATMRTAPVATYPRRTEAPTACRLPRDEEGRILRGVDPHEWEDVSDPGNGKPWPPGSWRRCRRCGVYARGTP